MPKIVRFALGKNAECRQNGGKNPPPPERERACQVDFGGLAVEMFSVRFSAILWT